MGTHLLHGMPERGWVLDDVSEEQCDERREAVEARALREAQDHACALELGEHHGVLVSARQPQAEPQRGVQRVGVHRHADHADAGPDENRGHLLGQPLHHDGSVRCRGGRGRR